MGTYDELLESLKSFLEDSGSPIVESNDLNHFRSIITRILDLKYKPDPGDSIPLEVILFDRDEHYAPQPNIIKKTRGVAMEDDLELYQLLRLIGWANNIASGKVEEER